MSGTKHGVPKVKTLGILAAAGSVSTEDYQNALAAAGFPGTRFRAHRLLNRFLSQGLATRHVEYRKVRYTLSGAGVDRRQPFCRWEITQKGRTRLAWLRKHSKTRRSS